MAERNGETKGETKDTLLNELESIKGLLQNEDDIPVLHEIIEALDPDSAPDPDPERQPDPETQSSLALQTDLELQPDVELQPGVELQPDLEPQPSKPRPQAVGENPFLPAHIRARLKGNRAWTEDAPPAQPLPQPSTQPASHFALQPLSRAQLIQELVHSYLPELEAQLRARLHAIADEQLRLMLEEDLTDDDES